MYIVANYDWFWRHPDIFVNFKDAKAVYDTLKEDNNIIEFFDVLNCKRKLVYPKEGKKHERGTKGRSNKPGRNR